MKKHISIITSKRQQKVLAVAIVSMLLSACGGGGGSNGTVPTTTTAPTTTTTPPTDTIDSTGTTPTTPTTPTTSTPFTSWSAVANDSTVVVPGMSQEVTQTTDPVAGKVIGIGTPTAVDTAASSFTETNSNGTITKLVIASRTGNVTFDKATGDKIGHLTINPSISAAVKKDQSSFALAADPSTQGWEYQSFGVWSTGRVAGSGNAGVMSIGAPTAGASIPTSGTATFTGKSIGFYTDATGTGHAAFSDLSVNANFAARTLDLSSTGTVKTNNYSTTSSASNLNLTGRLTYAAGENSFAGTLTTAGGPLTGTSTGRFYGPNAEELGGVFILKAGSGIETYGGAYGAKRGVITP